MNKRQEMPQQPKPLAHPLHISWPELEMLSALAFCAQTWQAESAFILMFSILNITLSVHETWILRQYGPSEEANPSDWYSYFFG